MDKRPLQELCDQRGVTRRSIETLLNLLVPPENAIRIRNIEYYINALTHRSALKEYTARKGSNERLEYMGDAVIQLIVTEILYDKYPEEDEGFLTRVRTKLVRGASLSDWARHHDLGNLILMNSKALEKGWCGNEKILENTFEALVGALYKDIGQTACKTFIHSIIDGLTDFDEAIRDDNYKDILMRRMQLVHSDMVTNGVNKTRYGNEIMPLYTVVDTTGDDHQKTFHVVVSIEGVPYGSGAAKQKRQAEQMAAQEALGKLSNA